jgi:hypothetical protein
MKIVVTGVTADGKSVIESVHEPEISPGVELSHDLFNGALALGLGEDRRQGAFYDIAPEIESAFWRMMSFAPGAGAEHHFTNSVDFDVVVAGDMLLGLDDEEVQLHAGDCVVVKGSSHTWTAGSEGCTMIFALLGARPGSE